MDDSTLARFWSKVSPDRTVDDCWMWLGAIHRSGYGSLRRTGTGQGSWAAHRLSYSIHLGEIPAGLLVCHECDVRSCVNPGHLFVGSYSDNMRDMVEKGRYAGGEHNAIAKLTRDDVLAIRARYVRGSVTMTALAAEFGIVNSHVHSIVHRKCWGWLP